MYEEVPSLTLSSFPVVQSGPYSIMSRSPGELLKILLFPGPESDGLNQIL